MNIFNINAEIEKRYSTLVVALAAITGMVMFLSRSETDYTSEIDFLIAFSIIPLGLLLMGFSLDVLSTKSSDRFRVISEVLYKTKLESDLIDNPVATKNYNMVLINNWERMRMEAIVDHRQDLADQAQKEIDKLKQELEELEK